MIFCRIEDDIEFNIDSYNRFSDVISSDQKIPSNGIALICFEESIKFVMTYKKSGRVATHIDRITFRNPVTFHEGLLIEDIIEAFPIRLKNHLRRQTENNISLFSKKVHQGLIKVIKDIRPDIFKAIWELQDKSKNVIPDYSRKVIDIIAQEKDAINLVFKMFNYEESDIPDWSSNDSTAPFLNGYGSSIVREDPMINHDSHVFGDWSSVQKHVQGAVEFIKEAHKITILNVNRQPLEKTLGVDLLIYHHTYDSYVLIQYKRMLKEKDSYQYRPLDGSYKSEFTRMEGIKKSLIQTHNESIKNYRLNNELFYFKLCPAKIENMHSNKMVTGMYIPLELWKLLLSDNSTDGPKGGKHLNFKNCRYLNNTQFINLTQNGWIGSKIEDSTILTDIIKSSMESNKSIILAKYEATDEQ
jgi:hypothetical protein